MNHYPDFTDEEAGSEEKRSARIYMENHSVEFHRAGSILGDDGDGCFSWDVP